MSENQRKIEEVIEKDGSCMTRTGGSSMRPLFKANDAGVLIRPEREIEKYDVVLYRNEAVGKYVLHRVVKVKGDTLIIRGDNTYIKEIVPRSAIIAYMTAFVRGGKRHEVTEPSYRFYSRFWNFIYPARLVLRKLRALLGRIKRKIFK